MEVTQSPLRMDKDSWWRDGCPPVVLNGMPMTSYAAPITVRIDQLKPNDLVRVNKFPKAKHDLEIWATVLAIAPLQQNPETHVSIQLAGGYKFVAGPDQRCYCRVPVDH